MKSHRPPIRGQNSWQHLAYSLITFVSTNAIAEERVVAKVNFKSKWILAIVALFGVSLIATGVFASASITINSGSAINLGAGKANVQACDTTVTVSTQQTYDVIDKRYELTSITIDDLDTTTCAGKTIKMTLDYQLCSNGADCADQTPESTTWSGFPTGTQTLTWGASAGTGITSTTVLPAIDTANVGDAYIAISAE